MTVACQEASEGLTDAPNSRIFSTVWAGWLCCACWDTTNNLDLSITCVVWQSCGPAFKSETDTGWLSYKHSDQVNTWNQVIKCNFTKIARKQTWLLHLQSSVQVFHHILSEDVFSDTHCSDNYYPCHPISKCNVWLWVWRLMIWHSWPWQRWQLPPKHQV